MKQTTRSLEGVDEAIRLQEAVEFIWREADLLDRHDYHSWLALWTAKGRYIVPIERDITDPAAALNIAYDDAEMREARVKRVNSGLAMSATPAARTVRTVSRFAPIAVSAEMIELRCAQQLIEYKYERTRILAADVIYRLLRSENGLALDEKSVRLINSDGALFGIGYLL